MLYFFPVIIGCGSADVGFEAAIVATIDAGADVRISVGAGGSTGGGAGAGGRVALHAGGEDAGPVWEGRPCASNTQCPPGQVCLGVNATCTPHCRTDADCFGGYHCGDTSASSNGVLVGPLCLADCRTDADCGIGCCLPFDGPTWSNVSCNSERRMCVPSFDCPVRNLCVR